MSHGQTVRVGRSGFNSIKIPTVMCQTEVALGHPAKVGRVRVTNLTLPLLDVRVQIPSQTMFFMCKKYARNRLYIYGLKPLVDLYLSTHGKEQ